MSISLLTSVPGGGKTSYAVWYIIKKAFEEGRPVFTCGIPDLTLPHIHITYAELRKWSERNPLNEFEPEGKQELLNIPVGALIVIDEVQKLWPAGGKAQIPDHIRYLEEHRHHGLDFFIMTQAPSFVHSHVLSLVEKHQHILNDWTGRKLYEWSEYCSTVRSRAAKDQAVKQRYKLPEKSFALYHSSTKHIKPEKTIPKMLFVTFFTVLIFPFLVYSAFDRVTSKGEATSEEILAQDDELNEVSTDSFITSGQSNIEQLKKSEVQIVGASYLDIQLVSRQIDWSIVSSCLSNETSCICYGISAERLVVPKQSCELAVKHGWAQPRRHAPQQSQQL